MGNITISRNATECGRVYWNFDRRSFSIYLLHMPFAGITANLLNRSEKLAFLTILRPIIVIIVTSCVIEGVIYCARKVKLLKYLIGCRE